MKKIIFMSVMIFVLLVSFGCSRDKEVSKELDSNVEEVVEEKKVAEPKTEEVKIDEELNSLLLRRNDVPNVKFDYNEGPKDPRLMTIIMKGDKVRILLSEENFWMLDDPNAIYLNTKTGEAYAYCESRRVSRCKDITTKYEIGYDKYLKPSPYKWLNDAVTGNVGGSEVIKGKSTNLIYFKVSKKPAKMWLDEHFKLPLKIEVGEEGNVYTYNYVYKTVDSVKDSELEHPSSLG